MSGDFDFRRAGLLPAIVLRILFNFYFGQVWRICDPLKSHVRDFIWNLPGKRSLEPLGVFSLYVS